MIKLNHTRKLSTMKKLLLSICICALSTHFTIAQSSEVDNKDNQIAMAVLAGPEELRAGATVLGFDQNGDIVVLKKGENGMICRSDDPNKKGFECVCYNKNMEPFMARGRELKKEGKSSQEIFDIRENEAKQGALTMPDRPSTLHIFYGKEGFFNSETQLIEKANYRYVIYIPWATQQTTGLPLKPNGTGHPWLMNPGTHRAHIMVTPASN